MYSCKKCNISKSSQFEGDIYSPEKANDLFYDPTKVDYNTIFYRNNIGIIASDNVKGREMIARLKLYRPIYSLGWLCDQLVSLIDKLQEKIDCASDLKHVEQYKKARVRLLEYYFSCNRIFIASYNAENLYNGSSINSAIAMEVIDNIDTAISQANVNPEDSLQERDIV